MRKFFHTLTNPQEWHTASIVAVGLALSWAFTWLFINAFDANF